MHIQDVTSFRKLFFLLRQINIHPAYLLFPIGISLVSAGFEGIGISLLIPILNGFLQQSFEFILEIPILGRIMYAMPEFVLENDRMLFGVLLATFITVYVLKNCLRFLAAAGISYFAERSLHHLRKTMFTKYLSFGKLFFDTTNIGHHSTLLLDFSRYALNPLVTIDKYINAIFSLAVYLTVMLLISWKLTLVALPLFVLLHFLIRTVVNHVQCLSSTIAKRGSELGKKSVEILSSIPLIKSHRTESYEQKLYASISNEKSHLDFQVHILQALIVPLQEIITLLIASSIFVGALVWFGRDQIASAPALIIYFYIIMNASNKFGALSAYRSTMASCSGPLDAVLTLFSNQSKYFVRGGHMEFRGLKSSIEFKNLSFAYLDMQEVLSNISFSVRKGGITAIVGPTGAGKSTLINLIMRYYDCPPHSIFCDGIDIREFSLDSYLRNIALVSQETMLLHDTLRNNITYGLKEVKVDALQETIERARLTNFIDHLPKGIETIIGDRGVRLSGGEKQRVAIARALLRNAEILILDEATSSLDSQTERLIQEAIENAVQGRTTIVIAHRLSTIKNADKIIVLDQGKMVEEGTFEELLQASGMFCSLWKEQKF